MGHVVGEVSESILLLAECLQFQLVGATSTGIDTMQQTLLGRLLELKGLSPTTDLDLSVSTDGEDLLPFAADTVEIVGQELSLFADVGGLGGFTVLLGTVFGLC